MLHKTRPDSIASTAWKWLMTGRIDNESNSIAVENFSWPGVDFLQQKFVGRIRSVAISIASLILSSSYTTKAHHHHPHHYSRHHYYHRCHHWSSLYYQHNHNHHSHQYFSHHQHWPLKKTSSLPQPHVYHDNQDAIIIIIIIVSTSSPSSCHHDQYHHHHQYYIHVHCSLPSVNPALFWGLVLAAKRNFKS